MAARHREWLLGLFAAVAKQGEAADPDQVARQLLMLYNAAMVEAHAGSPCASTIAADAGAAAVLLLAAA